LYTPSGHIHRNRPCLMDKHIQEARKVKCAQDASDVRESHLQEDMISNERRGFKVVHMQRIERRALQTIGAELFNKGKDPQLTARIPKCSTDDLEVCVRESHFGHNSQFQNSALLTIPLQYT
jgi:hypothetical protein